MTKQGINLGLIGIGAVARAAVSRSLGKRYLVEQISKIPGLPAKAAQILSLKLGVVESSRIEPLSHTWVMERLKQCHSSFFADLEDLDPAFAMASLGQVHRARMRDGRGLVAKIRYPEVAENLQEQLGLLLLLLRKFSKSKEYGLDVDDYQKFLKESFSEELDYRKEAGHQDLFRAAWDEDQSIIIPHVEKVYSDEELLVQSFEHSLPLDALLDSSHEIRQAVAGQLLRFFVKGLFDNGLVHADLHPRNWGFRRAEQKLVVYDFGSVLSFNQEIRSHLRRLAFDSSLSETEAIENLAALGFAEDKLERIRQKIRPLVRLLFEPFHQEVWSPGDWQLGARLNALLGEDRWWFRTAGPAWFMLLMRSASTVFESIRQLRVDVPVDVRVDVRFEVPDRRPQSSNLWIPGLNEQQKFEEKCKLRVLVTEGAEHIVEIEFPAHATEQLEDLIPDEVLERIHATGIHLQSLKQRAIDSSFEPQDLFVVERGQRKYRVWLE